MDVNSKTRLQIVDLDIRVPLADLESKLNQYCNDMNASGMTITVDPLRTRQGKYLHGIKIVNSECEVQLCAEDGSNGDVCFGNLKLSSLGERCYKYDYNDPDFGICGNDDPVELLRFSLEKLAKEYNGTFAYMQFGNDATIISEGTEKKDVKIGLVDSSGSVYCGNSKNVSSSIMADDDDEDDEFRIKILISNWINENPAVQQAIAGKPLPEQMDIVGKALINARNNDELKANEFINLFCQAGMFGFSNSTMQQIYKLIM